MHIKRIRIPCKIRLHNHRIVLVGLVCLIAITFILTLFRPNASNAPFKKTLRFKYVKNVANSSFAACRLPLIDPHHKSVLEFLQDLGDLRCEGRSFSNFENNVLRVKGEGIVSAHYRKIVREAGEDYHVFLSEPVSISNLANKIDGKVQSPSGM